MKKIILSLIFCVLAIGAFAQRNAVITFIDTNASTPTRTWPVNTIVYVKDINQWRLLEQEWSTGAFSATTNIHADPPDMSGTLPEVLRNITDAGSGIIISTTERSKLAGIASGAEVNVNADWNAVSGDAEILNKPTIPDDEAIQDVIGAMVTGNTETGITVTYDDVAGKLNFNVTSLFAAPVVTVFNIDGQSETVNTGTTLTGTKQFNYSIDNSENVSGNVTIAQGASTLSSSVSATGNSVNLLINDVTLANENDNVVWTISGTDTNTNPFSRTFTVTAVDQDEFLYVALQQSSDPATVSLTAPTQAILISGAAQSGGFSVGPTSANDHIIILAPTDHDLTFLANSHFPSSNIISTYTKTVNARTIAGQTYNAFVFGPVNAGFTQTYNYTLN